MGGSTQKACPKMKGDRRLLGAFCRPTLFPWTVQSKAGKFFAMDDVDKPEKTTAAWDAELEELVGQGNRIKPKGVRSKRLLKPIALIVWEDITAYTRVEIPEDFELLRLTKITVGILWKEEQDYLVLVQDYDLSNRGKGYRHNDFHIIPRGAVKEIRMLGELEL
jgi:hypothetical protein